MSEPLFFLSYSRQELYFAEAVALALQKAGIKIWFDLQQLEPGCNWPEEIKQGLEKCSGMIVIASRNALTSKYVASEWQHAIDEQKPIHVMLFEAVNFVHTTKIDRVTKEVLYDIHNEDLLKAAVSVIDARRGFETSISRMVQILKGGNPVHDPLPIPNRFHWPMKLPLAVTFVMWAMVLAIAFFGFLTIEAIPINLALVGIGLITTGWVGNRTWAFIQRGSYRQARIILILLIVLSAIFMLWLTPIFAAAAIVAMRVPDIHRYSPLGQGLSNNRRQNLQFKMRRKKAQGIWQNLAVFYHRVNGFIKAGIVAFSILFILIFGLIGLSSILSGNQKQVSFGLSSLAYAVPFVVLLFLHFRLRAAYKRLVRDGLGRAAETNLTYDIYAVDADSNLVDQVNTAMDMAGHKLLRRIPNHAKLDATWPQASFTIVVLTNNTKPEDLAVFAKDYSGKLLILLGSSLTDEQQKGFDAFGHYQWVDYRRRSPETLDAMADDLLIFGTDAISNSFGTRQTPQSFKSVIVPGRVAFYLGSQYIGLNFLIFDLIFLALQGNPSTSLVAEFVIFPLTFFLSIWISNRVVCREITIQRLTQINFAAAVIGSVVGLIANLATPIPAGYYRDSGTFLEYVIAGIVALAIGYFIARAYFTAMLGGWLPGYVPYMPLPGFKRDRTLWQRNGLTALTTILFTLVIFTGQPVYAVSNVNTDPNGATHYMRLDSGMLTLNVPQRWQEFNNSGDSIHIQEVGDPPIVAMVRRGSSPFNQDIANTLTATFFPGKAAASSITSPDTPIATAFFEDTDVTTQNIFQAMEAESTTQRLSISIWDLRNGFTSPGTPQSVLNHIQSQVGGFDISTVQTRSLGRGITRYDQTFRTEGNSQSDVLINRVVLYDTPSVSFAILISGDPDSMQAEQSDIDTLINSVQLDVPPAPTATPTDRPIPTDTPYPVYRPTPTIDMRPFLTFSARTRPTATPNGFATLAAMLYSSQITSITVVSGNTYDTVSLGVQVRGYLGRTLTVSVWPVYATNKAFMTNPSTGQYAGTSSTITPAYDPAYYEGANGLVFYVYHTQMPCSSFFYSYRVDVEYQDTTGWHSTLLQPFYYSGTLTHTCS